jgi:acyl-CoA synthetase (AMP-forming)/AMP-acid ligase II
MAAPKSIPAALYDAASQGDSWRGFTFVSEEGEAFYSFEEMAGRTARYAAAMLRKGLHPGDRVALALPDNAEFVFSFLGAMHAGLVPVPMYPPQGLGKLGFYLEHARHILRVSGASLLITSAQVKTVLGSLIGGSLRSISTVQTLGVDDTAAPLARLRPEDTAFLQFTSGSTSRPKGVVLTHESLSTNTQCISAGLELNPDDVGCAWLPLYHDMGLIGFVMTPITNCIPVVLMSPFVFLKRPVEWLRRMTRHRATVSFAPNFGYGLCASRVRERDCETLDLSHWRVAGCGAEPIQISTLENFHARFKAVGFDHKAFTLAYGLAENTLAVTFSPLSTAPRSERVRWDELTADGFASAADLDDTSAVTVANCGRQFAGHEVAIFDSDGNRCGSRQVGEIVVRGPSMMKGYYNDPETTAATIKDGWLYTGDLGFLLDGELFVCGRIKDLIIVAGRNYHPSDVELVVSHVPGIRTGRVVAFSVSAPDRGDATERVVVCAETKVKQAQYESVAEQIKSRVMEALSLRVSEVVLLGRGCLPRTSSGKLQRNKTRELYLNGKLETASRNEGKLVLLWHLAGSQWGFLKKRMGAVVTGEDRG